MLRRLSPAAESKGYFLFAVCRLLTAVRFSCSRALTPGQAGFSSCSQALALWLSTYGARPLVAPRSATCGFFPDRGLNPCLLHWQVDSLPRNHQGSPLLTLTQDCHIINEQLQSSLNSSPQTFRKYLLLWNLGCHTTLALFPHDHFPPQLFSTFSK